jgi:hypothetical protein
MHSKTEKQLVILLVVVLGASGLVRLVMQLKVQLAVMWEV